MAIQVRRGLKQDFDTSKLLPGELAAPLDTKELYAAFAPGDVKRIATHEDMTVLIKESVNQISEDYTQELQEAITNANQSVANNNETIHGKVVEVDNKISEVNTVISKANTAISNTNESAGKADTAADRANVAAEKAESIVLGDIATETKAGIVKSGGNVQVATDGTMNIDLSGKLDKTGDSKDNTVTFTEAETDTDIATGEKHSILFGKLLKSIKTFRDTKLNKGNDYRPNLLNNGDFKINSNGKSTYGVPYSQTLDKWQLLINGDIVNNGTVTVNANSITLTKVAAAPFMYIQQFLEKNIYSKLRNKTITYSFKYRGSETRINIRCNNNSSYVSEQAFETTPEWKIASFTWNVQDIELTEFRIAIMLKGSETMNSEVEWIKLEINDYATPFIPKSYKEELLNCSENVGYSPNHLINGDFRIWQRGTSFTNPAGYTVDRWFFKMTGVIQQTDNGMKITANANIDTIIGLQRFERNNGIQLAGKTVTMSARVRGNFANFRIQLGTSTQWIGDSTSGYTASETDWIELKRTVTMITDITDATGLGDLRFNVLATATSGQWIEIDWIKLEVNDHATPFIPKLYSEELRDCQRYYEKSPGWVSSIGVGGNQVSGVLFSVEKRINPTVILTAQSGQVNSINNWGDSVTLPISKVTSSKKGIQYIDCASTTKGDMYVYSYVADAEI